MVDDVWADDRVPGCMSVESLRVEIQPVETTLYSLSDAPPAPADDGERREGQRHMTL